METISSLCAIGVVVAILATLIFFIIWVIKLIAKKPHKRMGIAMLISSGCFVFFTLLGTFTSPTTYCDHEYKLVESEAASCEKDGSEKYHCSLCDSDKTEIVNKLGHDMVDIRRVEPTYDTAGEYVRGCTRCDYVESEVLAMLVKPTPTPMVTPSPVVTPEPSSESDPTPTLNEDTSTPVIPEEITAWQDTVPISLAKEIEAAFAEIGENPDNIVNVEYVDTHTSGYIFERKCYRVEFSYSFLNPGWKHAKEYRIKTQNYFDGEPEKEQYPDEFLVTISFWIGEDGHGTNINQWSWTGNGEMQK